MNPYAASLASYLEPDDRAQAALADAVGTTQASISRWANGKRFPDRSIAVKIDEATKGAVSLALWQAEAARRIGLSPESEAA